MGISTGKGLLNVAYAVLANTYDQRQHVQMFPHNREFSKNRLIELRTILTYHLHGWVSSFARH